MKIKINCQAPFNFDLSAKIFSNGDPQIQRYEDGVFRQLIVLDNKIFLISVESSGTVDDPELTVTLTPDNELEQLHITMVKELVTSMFNLDFKLQDFYDEIKLDPVLFKLIEILRGLNSPTTPTFFEALTTSIIDQQISLKVANSMKNRMIKKFGNMLTLNGDVYYGYPGPEILYKLEDDDLRGCGLSYRKASYIIGFSRDLMEGKFDLDGLKNLPTDKIVDELLKIRGVGLWTAEMAVLRGLHRLNSLPADDVGIKRIVSHYYHDDEPISRDDLLLTAKKWGRWRGLAVYYLIVGDIMSIEI